MELFFEFIASEIKTKHKRQEKDTYLSSGSNEVLTEVEWKKSAISECEAA